MICDLKIEHSFMTFTNEEYKPNFIVQSNYWALKTIKLYHYCVKNGMPEPERMQSDVGVWKVKYKN